MKVEEVFPNLYKIEVPLPGDPLKATNSYVIKGENRNLVIDTGFDFEESLIALQGALEKISVNLNITDYFITHLHNDHLDLVPRIVTSSSKIYLGNNDLKILNDTKIFKKIILKTIRHDFPYKEFKNHMEIYLGNEKRAKKLNKITAVSEIFEGDAIKIGGYEFHCLETPGHTWGHMCLYEKNKKILLSGDHILADTTPVILSWAYHENPLKKYLTSLDRVYKLDVKTVLPGHGSIFYNCPGRILEIKEHHKERLEEIIAILQANPGGLSAYDIASRMGWDLPPMPWKDVPVFHRWLATGEALAHLYYLEEEGRVKSRESENRESGGKILFYSD